ncbi:MAG: tetratricopeptide repeat protein [Bacteroidetes bacterium]|nr:tetratricopeptide repeat protein [Bacteroidota bacterium]MBK9672873.1 tetratricopeptide repeat protein [Bacteroidota bacterium]MBK9801032.1 tetratricopeptide repeat protein [Bacteroidota bacterium]
MKKVIFLFAIFILMATKNTAQTTKTKLTVVPLVENKIIELDGGIILVTGQSRVILRIELPVNTVSWYYIFSSYSNQEAMENNAGTINLVSQLTRVIDATGSTAKIASSLLAPSGSGACSVYLFENSENANKFYNKNEQSLLSDTWSYIELGSNESSTQGKGVINGIIDGVRYLGIKSMNSPVIVTIEVAAIVEEVQEESVEEQKAMNFGSLGWKCFERGEYDKCFELSKKAIELDNSLSFVHFNIGLVYLIKNQISEAIEKYNDAIVINRKTDDPKHSLDGALQDIIDNMDKFTDKNTAKDLKELLENELQSY